ncbi:MAG: bL21 family ribosomal protein, partial [Pseudomonadota bacterium]
HAGFRRPLFQDLVDQIKDKKVINFVRRRRKHSSKRTVGHRQQLTLVQVTEILEKGASKSGVKAAVGGAGFAAAVATAPKAEKPKAEKPKAEKPKAEKKAAAPKEDKAEAPAGADDLKELSGVGPALEKKLHAAGVTTFAQVAAWTEEDVAAMDEQLNFKGRIEREGWIEQAKAKVAEG